MTNLMDHAPRCAVARAAELARDLFGLTGNAELLPSERDQNFKLTATGGAEYVLKIANATEDRAILELQNRTMDHVAAQGEPDQAREMAPGVIKTKNGESIVEVELETGRHLVRLLTYLPGKPLALAKPHSSDLLVGLGRFFGELDRRLADFSHPAAVREFHWDLARAGEVIDRLKDRIADPDKRSLIDRFLTRYRAETEPKLADLPTQVIHSDGNDYNVLVSPEGRFGLAVSGVIDFGDMVHSQRVNELAIVCAYAIMGKGDPLAAAAAVTAGYHEKNPLTEAEVEVLFDLIFARLAMSVCHSADQFAANPDNDYLTISRKPAWAALNQLSAVHPRWAGYTLRQACGFKPVPQYDRFKTWFDKNLENFGPLVEADFAQGKQPVLDLSVGSPFFGAGFRDETTEALTERLMTGLAKQGAVAAVGRYGEPRLLYTQPEFEAPSEELPERRTIHIGLDIFMAAGSKILAPWPGRVHSFYDNQVPLDYGPAIVLEHKTDDGLTFYTMYGHLSQDSLTGLAVGQAAAKGQEIARMGTAEVNGGWPPHVHFQIILDMLDEWGTFFGVGRERDRDLFAALCPDPTPMLNLPQAATGRDGRNPTDLLAVRKARLGYNLSISYRRPLKIVRGEAQYLYTDQGQQYLDGVNNVCHVGHCHPKVVASGQAQMGVLNTNTRYLHDNIIDYAERLLSTFPDPLEVVYFVCSGSEANELAMRLARAHADAQGLVCLAGAYHGNSQGNIDVSPYKHDRKGGKGRPAWVTMAESPDGYRGPIKGFGPEVGAAYAKYIDQAMDRLEERGFAPAGFICESILGCGGQVVLPEGYLKAANEVVHARGAVTICDEVQCGFGRVGTHMWAFETQNAVPDIVTLGKPIGNGHPMAAVVTTAEIAAAFNNGMEYFNTFGGNPVSCAVGLAVLEAIEEDNLQANALTVGDRLLAGFKELEQKYPLIGHVRGLGLFQGVELVRDRETLEPATEEASHLVNRLKDHGLLFSTDGPLDNVFKLKPPICFSLADADRLIETMDKVLAEDRLQI